jgi:hypothetical protein
LLERHKCGRAPTLSAATREFYAEWRSYIQLAPDKSRSHLCARVIDERPERQNADGCIHILLNARKSLSDSVSLT